MGETGIFNRSVEVVWRENRGPGDLFTKINGRFFVLREGHDGAIRLFIDGPVSGMLGTWTDWEAAKTEASVIAAARACGLGRVEVQK